MQPWLDGRDPDVLLLQEVRAPDAELRKALPGFEHVAHTEAAAKGRAGVAVASKAEFSAVRIGFAHDPHFEDSGRWIEVDVDTAVGPMTFVSAYVHSGEVGTPQQDDKYRFLDAMDVRLAELGKVAADTGREALVAGDLNIGHTERDIKNWKGNRGKAGFLEDERAHFDHWFDALGWVDTQRRVAGTSTARSPGGPGGARRSTTTRAGASTTSSSPRASPSGCGRSRPTAPPATPSGSPTTLRSWPSTPPEGSLPIVWEFLSGPSRCAPGVLA